MSERNKFDLRGCVAGDVVLFYEDASGYPSFAQIKSVRPGEIKVHRIAAPEVMMLANVDEGFDPATGWSLDPSSNLSLVQPPLPSAAEVASWGGPENRVDRPVILPEHPCIVSDDDGGITAAFEAIPESLRRKALAARDAEAERLEALFDRVSDMPWEEWLVEYGVTVTPPDDSCGEPVHIRSGAIGGKPRRFRLETTQNERYVSGEEVARMVTEADAHAVKKGAP